MQLDSFKLTRINYTTFRVEDPISGKVVYYHGDLYDMSEGELNLAARSIEKQMNQEEV